MHHHNVEPPLMKELTPYPAINRVLTQWAEGLKRLLSACRQ